MIKNKILIKNLEDINFKLLEKKINKNLTFVIIEKNKEKLQLILNKILDFKKVHENLNINIIISSNINTYFKLTNNN